jgi:hypothetical protein
MKKFSKILENIEGEKSFKVDAHINLVIKASNEGEAAYLADSALSSVKNQSQYTIDNIEETQDQPIETIGENLDLQENSAKLFAEWLRHNCVISSDEGYYYGDEIYDVDGIYKIYRSKK